MSKAFSLRPRIAPRSSLACTAPARRRLLARVLLGLCVVALVGVGVRTLVLGTNSEGGTGIETLVLHWQPVRGDAALPVYRDLLNALPQTTQVVIASGSETAEGVLRSGLGPAHVQDPRLAFVRVQGPMGPWARDRYIPFLRDGVRYLYVPPDDRVSRWELGSQQVPAHLRRRNGGLHLVSGEFSLEGGDVLLSNRHVFVGEVSAQRNGGSNPQTRAALRTRIAQTFGRQVVFVGEGTEGVPYDHIDMFLSVIDDDTLLLGDPRLAVKLLWAGRPVPARVLEGELGSFQRSTQEQVARVYDRVEASLRQQGFRVVRIPILHGQPFDDGRRGTILNWNNALLDRGRMRAYLPRYQVPVLDGAAAQIWRDAGFTVHPIDARAAIVHGGAVRCLTNAFFAGDADPGRGPLQ